MLYITYVTRIVDLPHTLYFYLIYGRRLKQGEELVCSIIMRSDSATLRNSITRMILCLIARSKSVKILIL